MSPARIKPNLEEKVMEGYPNAFVMIYRSPTQSLKGEAVKNTKGEDNLESS